MGRSTNKGIKGPQSVSMTILHFLNEKRNINKIPVIKLYKNLTAVNLFKNLHKPLPKYAVNPKKHFTRDK